LKMDPRALYDFTMWIARSSPEVKQAALLALETVLKKHLTDFKKFGARSKSAGSPLHKLSE
ncbi:MAG: hypothetical protein KGK30_02700, partial [Elusimicrobia bacterium]|nr:hypothetical protein [Elusimicrobiota bacterium]